VTEPRFPAELLDEVGRDLRPVRPLASPAWRAAALLPLGLLLLVGAPLVWGFRSNLATLGPALTWGLSALQTLAGLLVVGVALREAVPGRELSGRAVALTLAAAAALFLAQTALTAWLFPTTVPPAVRVRYAWECLGMATLTALPALAAAAWLVVRALPSRPTLAGAVYGLGAGLMADAGVRMFCWVTTPAHVLIAHGGAVVAMTGLGALIAGVLERARGR